MKKIALVIALSAIALTGCAHNKEVYLGAVNTKPCAEQYKEIGPIARCEYDTGYHTN